MLKVLVLDDDPTTLLLLSTRLAAEGMEVVSCHELEAAEAILDHARVDAVVTDLCLSPMGGMDGTRLIRHVATHFPETQVVAMSSHEGKDLAKIVLAFGASDFVPKPVKLGDLVRTLRARHPAPERPGAKGSTLVVENLDEFLAVNPIFAHLQPIVDLEQSTVPFGIHGVEALARAPRESILRNPEILFDYASRKNRLFETDMICIEAGLREAVRLGRGDYRIFLNVQPRSMSNPAFASRVNRLVEEAGFGPDQVVFELTEQETILNPRAFGAALAEIRRKGYRIALDDFGVGFANLNLILDLLPQYVKISGYFARGLALNPARQEGLAAIHGLLQKLRIPAIVESVETEEELEIVRGIGLEYAQGYHFSKPAPALELVGSGRYGAWA